MDKQPVKIALVVGALVLAVAGLVFGMKAANASEEYKPSPGLDRGAGTAPGSVGGGTSSAPGMPAGPPPGMKPGSVR